MKSRLRTVFQRLAQTMPGAIDLVVSYNRADFPHNRDFAFVRLDVDPKVIYVSDKILKQATLRIIGLLMHEMGHILAAHRYGLDHTERQADAMAETHFKMLLRYDTDNVQTIGPGRRPRPKELPK